MKQYSILTGKLPTIKWVQFQWWIDIPENLKTRTTSAKEAKFQDAHMKSASHDYICDDKNL